MTTPSIATKSGKLFPNGSLVRGGRSAEAPQPDPPPQRNGYSPCPICGDYMNRRNYGYRGRRGGSGIVIEYCKSHGLWFNCGELAAILEWLRTDGTVDDLGQQAPEPKQPVDSAVFYAPIRDDFQESEFNSLMDLAFGHLEAPSFSTTLFGHIFQVRF